MSDRLENIKDLIDEVFGGCGEAFVGRDILIEHHYWDENDDNALVLIGNHNTKFVFSEASLLAGEFDGTSGMMTFKDPDGTPHTISFVQEIPYDFDTEDLEDE